MTPVRSPKRKRGQRFPRLRFGLRTKQLVRWLSLRLLYHFEAFPNHLTSQGQERNLGAAQVAQGIIAGQAAADVQQRWGFVEDAAIITATITAGDQHGPKQWEAYLAAVDMAGQHQVDAG